MVKENELKPASRQSITLWAMGKFGPYFNCGKGPLVILGVIATNRGKKISFFLSLSF